MWTENESGEDRRDVGWTPETGVEHQVGRKEVKNRMTLCILAFMSMDMALVTSRCNCLEEVSYDRHKIS